jgi:hypothetical protein
MSDKTEMKISRYDTFDFSLWVAPEPAEPKKSRASASRKIIGKYCDAHSIDVYKLLSDAGYQPDDDYVEWIRPGSESGKRSLTIYSVDGIDGVTVYSGQCENLEAGKWYSRDALYVAWVHANDWKAAARHAHEVMKLPEVETGLDEDRIIAEVLDILAEQADCFCSDSGLVELIKRDGQTVMRPLPHELIRERLSTCLRFVTFDVAKDGKTEKRYSAVPKWVVDNLSARFDFAGIRRLTSVVDCPCLLPSGKVLCSPGYDEQSELYLAANRAIEIPDSPSREDAIAAAERLLDVVSDFPFTTDSDRSVWLAMLLTIVGRPAIKGCCPMFATSANAAGVGKGLSTDCTCLIALGCVPKKRSMPADDAEMRKSITSVIQSGDRVCYFDNVDRPIGTASLDLAVTADRWSDRILGTNRQIDAPMRTVFIATGNNISIKADSGRRCFLIQLDTNREDPENRDDFKHPNLLAHVERHCDEYLRDALIILRGYISAKMPCRPKPLGSFENWSRLILGAIEWLELPSPMEAFLSSREADESKDQARMLVRGLVEIDPNGFGCTVGEIVSEFAMHGIACPKCPSLVAWISAVVRGKNLSHEIGNALRRFKGRIVAGHRIHCESAGGGIKRWSALPLDGKRSSEFDTVQDDMTLC